MVFDFFTAVKRTVLARVSDVKYSRSEELALFIVLYVALYVTMVHGDSHEYDTIIDRHYFIYQLYTSRSPLYKTDCITLYMDMLMERPFSFLI